MFGTSGIQFIQLILANPAAALPQEVHGRRFNCLIETTFLLPAQTFAREFASRGFIRSFGTSLDFCGRSASDLLKISSQSGTADPLGHL
jgi:hypothetical protein